MHIILLCFGLLRVYCESLIDSFDIFAHILQGCVRQWDNHIIASVPTKQPWWIWVILSDIEPLQKHNKARPMCIFVWMNHVYNNGACHPAGIVGATIQGLYSLSGRMSCRKISWSLESARFRFRLLQSPWNLAGTSAALLPKCLSNFRAIRSL